MPRLVPLLALAAAGCFLDRGVELAPRDGGRTDAGEPRDAGTDATADAGPPADCPEGSERSCGQGVGECTAGVQRCTGGRWSECTGAVEPQVERCDGLDGDCDGVSDREQSGLCPAPMLATGRCTDTRGRWECMYRACPTPACCAGVDPCAVGFSCTRVAFAADECPSECAGECAGCPMCVRRP